MQIFIYTRANLPYYDSMSQFKKTDPLLASKVNVIRFYCSAYSTTVCSKWKPRYYENFEFLVSYNCRPVQFEKRYQHGTTQQ